MWKLKNYLRPYWVWSVLAPLMMMVEVLKQLFSIDELMLEGGGVLNGSFLNED